MVSQRVRPVRARYVAAAVALLIAVAAAASIAGLGPLAGVFNRLQLPLKDQEIIRRQSAQKGVDPALVAAIIYQESRFHDQTSRAGAKGLMQILPPTADFIARQSGARNFSSRDLERPEINIAYGTWYLQYLLQRYQGNTQLAVAAYNAGEQNVDEWIQQAGGPSALSVNQIPFSETRQYVRKVLQLRGEYRQLYGRELAS